MKARSLSFILGLIAALALLVGFSASSASAQPSSLAQQQMSHSGISDSASVYHPGSVYVDSRSPFFYTTSYLGSDINYNCDYGETYKHPLSETDGIYIWLNDCVTRVWLHEDADGGGWGYCISPGSTGTVPDEYAFPGNIQITVNRNDCSSTI